jgi:hypothetical protein
MSRAISPVNGKPWNQSARAYGGTSAGSPGASPVGSPCGTTMDRNTCRTTRAVITNGLPPCHETAPSGVVVIRNMGCAP